MLQDDNGNWIEERDTLKQMANDFYQVLFSDDGIDTTWFQTVITFSQLQKDEVQHIRRLVEDDEVKSAIFSMSPWKAPGPDGFPVGYYQKFWGIVGRSVCDFVKSVWSNPQLLKDVNCTDICLIPKVDQPEHILQFRPISLCNTLYKIVSKVMTN